MRGGCNTEQFVFREHGPNLRTVSKPLGGTSPLDGAPGSVEDVLALVRERGGRATHARRVLLEGLFAAAAGLSAEELTAWVQVHAPDVHPSTIYRNLEDLQELGVVVHSHLGHGAATYQLADHARAHLLCEACGATIEAPDEFFRELARRARTEYGFAIDPRHFAIVGRCAACAAT